MIELLKLATNPKQALIDIQQYRGPVAYYNFFGKELFFIADWKAAKSILELEGAGKVGRNSLYAVKKPTFGDGLFNSFGETWISQRRMIQPFFSKNGIQQWEKTIVKQALHAAQKFGDLASGTEIDLSSEFKSLIQRILIGVMFGQNDSDNPVDHELVKSIDLIVEGLFPSFLAEMLGKGYFKHLLFVQNKRTDNAIRYFHNYVSERITIDNNSALVTLLSKTTDRDGCPMAQHLMLDESITIFLAGQDSTVNTLIWFFYLLGQHADVHDKLIQEINQLDGAIGFSALHKLPYTRAALYETMRLYPQAIAIARDAEQDIKIDGHQVNIGSGLIINVYGLHRNSAVWQKPCEYIPERFLAELTETQKASFMPFGAGIHNCVGKYFAEAEMLIVIAAILKYIKLDIAKTPIGDKMSITLKPGKSLIARKL